MVTWHIEIALYMKIQRIVFDFNKDRTKTSQPNFAQLKFYQVQMIDQNIIVIFNAIISI